MCVILGCRSKKPDLLMLKKCNAANDDGAGVAWFADGQAHYKKGLGVQSVFDLISALPLPFIIHFRAASSGTSKANLLNHPFIVAENSPLALEGSAEKLLFHNGFFPNWREELKSKNIFLHEQEADSMSDTRALACILAKEGDDFIKSIAKGRFIIVNGKTETFNFYGESWEFEDGIYFSNTFWKHKQIEFYETWERHWEVIYSRFARRQKLKSKLPDKHKKTQDIVPNQKLLGFNPKNGYTPQSNVAPNPLGITISNVVKDGIICPVVISDKEEIPTNPKNREEQIKVIESFNVCACDSVNKQKKKFRRFCKAHGLFFTSWRDAKEIWRNQAEQNRLAEENMV